MVLCGDPELTVSKALLSELFVIHHLFPMPDPTPTRTVNLTRDREGHTKRTHVPQDNKYSHPAPHRNRARNRPTLRIEKRNMAEPVMRPSAERTVHPRRPCNESLQWRRVACM